MKLLLDENLAARLAQELADLYPGSTHIMALGLGGAGDRVIWARAAAEGFVLVTKDDDFHRLTVLLGPPPKVIWIRLGNCATTDVARLLLAELRVLALDRGVAEDARCARPADRGAEARARAWPSTLPWTRRPPARSSTGPARSRCSGSCRT